MADATCFYKLAKRAGTRYECGFLLWNTAGGVGVGEGVEDGGRRQYVLHGLRELEDLANEQTVSRLVATAAGRELQVQGSGLLIGTCQGR